MRRIVQAWLSYVGERFPILAKLLLVTFHPFPRLFLSVARATGVDEPVRNRMWTIVRGPLVGRRLTGLFPDEIAPILANVMEIKCASALSSLALTGAAIIDVGASYGYYSLLFSRLVGKDGHVYSFEPDSRSFHRLMQNLALNQVENVTPVPIGISNTAGLARWVSFHKQPWLSRVVQDRPPEHGSIDVVPMTTLDGYSAAAGISEKVRLVKIDVEGAECAVLEGMRRLIQLSLPAVFCELHSASTASQVQALLLEIDYEWKMIEYASEERQHILAFPRSRARQSA